VGLQRRDPSAEEAGAASREVGFLKIGFSGNGELGIENCLC
jgi:hypothetical protein